jgi:putative ABC transport system ATP-binding protein
MANNDPIASRRDDRLHQVPETNMASFAVEEQPTGPVEAMEKLGVEKPGELDERPTLPEQQVIATSDVQQKAGTLEGQPTLHEQQAIARQDVSSIENQPTSRQPAIITSANESLEASGQQPQRVISVRNMTKIYAAGGKTTVQALRGISLDIYPGEFVAIMGPSGSGKSTFMNMLGCLDRPTAGEYWLAGRLVSRMSTDELANMRNQLLGFVFQGFNLLGRATALRNVMLPMIYAGVSKREQERRARKVLTLVGLGARMNHKPPELSGGQQQRVAIARALVNGPALLLADEPTGALDSRTGVEIMGVLQALNEQGLTIVLVTHDLKVAQYATRQVTFLDGSILRDEPVLHPRSAQEEWAAMVNAPAVESNIPVKGGTP